MQLSDCVAPVT